jgi:hypothetical protein
MGIRKYKFQDHAPHIQEDKTPTFIGQKIIPADMDRIAKFLILLVAALVIAPGCFAEEQKNESVTTPVIEEVIEVADATNGTVAEESSEEVADMVIPDFTANETVTLLEMGINQTVAVSLTAEEADGIWNITWTEGLEQVGNSTITGEGTEEFIIKALTAGNQTFSAIHEGAATEAGETYSLDIVVAEE